jgi:LysM repeat protein
MYLRKLKRRIHKRLAKKSSFPSLSVRPKFTWQQAIAGSLLLIFLATVGFVVLPLRATLASNDRERAAFVIGTRIDPVSLTVRDDERKVEIVLDGTPAVGGPVQEPVPRPTSYTIKAGDTLSEIAIQFGLSSFDLVAVNPTLSRHAIQPGQVITIPETEVSDAVIASLKQKEETAAAKASKATTSSATTKTASSVSATYIYPMAYKMISQYFGEGGHAGVDFATNEGVPIYATGSGCIIHKATGWNGGYGNVLIQSLGNNRSALYGHLSAFAKLNIGDCVEQGDLIGYNGNTGRSTGPHLHFEIRVNGRPVNPLPYLKR